ncbi:MAG TPA: D-alanyl-D-alanine carboxypeptidase [Hyphomicrobiaceae bacterium]|nr:D-alanyl-D-alanine carboxypeptidase [Hyphomicrobiaceae bacterium]
MALLAVALALAPGWARASGKSAVLVVDANSGAVLHQSAADEPRHPASLAKMMTLYLAFERIEQGRLSYQTKLKISANAAETAPTKLGLEEGEEIALIDAVKALITKSANDMAVAIAEHIAGSEEAFARMMTQKARQLGMTATTFRNASGLPDDEQVTTARDMVTLALRLQDDFPNHYPLFATRTFTYKDETFRNHNSLLFNFPGTDGLKTGYTRASGFNLVASVRRGQKHVVGVVFGGASAATRDAAMRTFLNMGLVKASNERTRRPSTPLLAQKRPAPQRVADVGAVPTPRRVERPHLRPVEAPPAPVVAAPAPPPGVAVPPASPSIEIARVRTVRIEPRAAAAQPADTRGTSGHDVAARAEPPQRAPSHQAADERPRVAPPAWVGAPPPPSAVRERPAVVTGASLTRGAAPSTLDAQAANLARGERPVTTAATPPPAVPDPVPASRPTTAATPRPAVRPAPPVAVAAAEGGSFHIQIGSYQSEAEALRRLVSARELAPALLAGRSPVTTQFKQGAKTFYRARYAGFEAKAAASACSELKRLKIDCLVMKAE